MRAMGGEAQGNLLAEPGPAAGHEDAFSLEEVSVEHERANPAIRIVAAQPGSHGFAKLIHYCTSSVNRSRSDSMMSRAGNSARNRLVLASSGWRHADGI